MQTNQGMLHSQDSEKSEFILQEMEYSELPKVKDENPENSKNKRDAKSKKKSQVKKEERKPQVN